MKDTKIKRKEDEQGQICPSSIDYYQRGTVISGNGDCGNSYGFEADNVTITIESGDSKGKRTFKTKNTHAFDPNHDFIENQKKSTALNYSIVSKEGRSFCESEKSYLEGESIYELSDETAMSWDLCIRGSSFVVGGIILIVFYIIGGFRWDSIPGKLLLFVAIVGTVTILMTWYFHFRKISRESWKLIHEASGSRRELKGYTRM